MIGTAFQLASEMPIAFGTLLETDAPWYMNVVAAAFLAAGVWLLVGQLRRSLFFNKAALEDDVKRWHAEGDYWRTMDEAVNRLSDVVEDIETKSAERTKTLTRLTEEATIVTQRLERLIESARSNTTGSTRTLRKPTERVVAADVPDTADDSAEAVDDTDADEEKGRIVHIDTARAALARNHRRVYELFDAGNAVIDISKDTGLQIGEIELILAMRGRNSSAS